MAEFYKKAFDFEEVHKTDGPLAYGYHLIDGTIDLAILRFKTDQIGKGLDYTGLHHFGILVDEVEKFAKKVEALGGTHYMDQAGDRAGGFEVKLYGKACCSTSPNTPGPAPSRSRWRRRKPPSEVWPSQK
jgi:catechol 2,3-dioxygenase-like lactoylglutathione lyase family enzyme